MTPNEWALLTAELAAKWNSAKILIRMKKTRNTTQIILRNEVRDPRLM
jgi:hypothetical protein